MIMKTLYTIYTSFAKRLAVVLTFLMTIGAVFADTYTWTLVSGDLGSTGSPRSSVKKDNVTWTTGYTWGASDATKYFGWDTSDSKKGVQIGSESSSNKCTKAVFSTSDISGTITNVTVNGSHASSGGASIVIKVGGETVKSSTNFTTAAADYSTGTISKIGQIEITISNSKAKAFYLKSIKVTYTPTPSGYAVTYNNGGHGTAPSSTTASSVTLSAITATGYTNTGWIANVAVKNTSTGTTINENTLITNGTNVTLTQATTFTAQWEAKTSTISFDQNDGEGGQTATVTATYDQPMPTPITLPTRYGHTFGGYYDGEGGTGTQYYTAEGASARTWDKTSADITLYAKWTEKPLTNYRTTCSTKADPNLSWSASTCVATMEVDNEFPTLTNPYDLLVRFSSSDPTVATIDENNGTITLLKSGTTTITASYDEDENYLSASASYTLTVHPSNCRWVETEIGDIDSGDEVVITMTTASGVTYALPSEKFTSGAPDATPVNVDGNSLELIIPQIVWIIYKDGDNLTFESKYDQGNYLAFTNDDTGVRVNANNSNRNFVVDDVSGYLKNTQTNDARYLGVHNTNFTWYSYKTYSVNTGAQTLKFYKRECLDASKVWVEGNLTNVTCSPQLPQQLAKEGSITLTFTAADGYALPNDVTVTNATKTWNQTTGELTISNPTDNVMVTVEAVELHTITWMVGSNSVLTEEVANATGVTQTPDNPTNGAIGECANAFMGWTETSLGSAEGQSAPADLCTAAQMKAKHTSVTGNKTFYAVFATKSSGGGAEIGTVVFSEDFSSFDPGDKMTGTLSSGTGRSIYGSVSVTYSYHDGTDADTKIYDADNAGGTSPELLVGKKSSTFTISGIPSAGAAKLQLSYKQNAKSLTSEVSGTGYSGGTQSSTKQTTSTIITVGSASTFNLTFTGPSGSDNARLDDICITVEETSVSYSNYVTNCCALAPATNLTVSGTTANTATLTWTAPSSTTGITKLQVRNAETDAVVVDNIAVNTTTTTIDDLTECTSYQYYVVSVGEDCEVVSNIVTAQPFGNAKTVNYDYNGGTGSPASFTTNCSEQEIILPSANRIGYTFEGWYTAATGGTRVGGAGDKYDPITSPITIHAQWTINQYTVTWNPNGGKWGESTADIVHTYDYGAKINLPADPTRDGYRFIGWNTTVASTMPATNITYTAQWKQNYTITFHDGDDTTPWTQTIDAESIDLNTYVGTHACGEYNFAGWSTASTQYNDQTANITTWVTGTYTPTANIHLYAVYVKGDLATDFTLNCDGGVYEIWEKGHNQHMAGRQNGGGDKFYTTEWYNGDCTSCEGTDGAPFTITKVADNTYTLQNADGQYITGNSYDEGDLNIEDTWENADKYKWTISAGSNGTWRFTNKAATTYALVFYDPYFQLRTATNVTNGSSYYDLELTPAQTNVYQSNPYCGAYTITFETHGGVFIQGNYAYPTAVTSNLTGKTTSKFPAAELDGYTFAGWKDGTPQDEINYEPLLKKPDDNLVVSSNKTYHAVYYYYDEEEDIDWSEEFTTGIYADVNGIKYFLAGTPDHGTMSSTTDCGYVSEVTITPGTGENAGKYKITVNSVGMAPEAGETDLVAGTAWWTITETSAGSGEYKISGADKKNIVLFNSSWGHYTYNQGSEYGNNYYYPRFGKCLEHHWTSNPAPKPSLNLSGEVYVTATNARGIMATSTLKVSAQQLNANEKVNITSNSNDVYFSADCTVNFVKANKPTNTLTITASPSGVIEQDIYVHYKPSAEGNGTPASVVVSANLATPNPSITDDQTIYVRNLPAKFVIATKVGATWYALPANMSEATNPLGVVVEVDETTMTTIAPNTTTYTLWPVKTTATEYDRYTNVTGAAYGDRVRFAAVNYEQKGLWANNNNNGSTIRNYAVIDALGDDGFAGYEWKITTTVVDGHWQYTLQTDQSNNQKYLHYWTAASGGAKWGTYASGNDKLYFLPVTETKPFDYKVVEWYPTKVLIQTDAAITNPIVKIGGILIDHVTCTNKGGKLYEISGLSLAENPTKVLTLSYTADEVTYTNSKVVPIILSRETMTISGEPFASLTKEVYNYADLVVRDGATLTMDGTQEANTLWDVTIYPTSKISVPESKKLTVHSLTFFGGIDEIYNGSTYTLNKYGVPELSLKGSLKKSISTIDYLMRVNLDQMYSLAVPYDVQLADIKYWDGSDIALGTALYVSAYDGEARANQSKKTWIYETDFNPATLKAGVGYTISAELQSGVGSEYSILRMPMVSNVENDATEGEKKVSVTAHGIDANITDNHKGWNLVGNPYMTTITGADDDDLVLGYLQETGSGPWKWVENTYRYVTIPADNGKDYSQPKFTDAVLPPFKNFFVQVGTTGELVFDLGTRQSMPARSTQAAIEKEVEFEILMSNATRQDNTGLLISEEYSPAYEINADLEKMIGSMSVYTIYGGYKLAYNALSPINASEWIPMGYIAPAAGEYTLSLDDVENIAEQVEHVYIIDYNANNIVDLMDEEYKFTTDKEQNNNRFAINVVLVQDKDNTTTGLDMIQGNNAAPIKFIHQDKMYIYNEGIIYDATGKQVTNINK